MAKEIRKTNLKPLEKETLADKFVSIIGSWRFIVGQSCAMVLWVVLNTVTPFKADPFPYILLNLLLSTQAALIGPIILMSSSRQGDLDRKRDVDHYMLDIEENRTLGEMSDNLKKVMDSINDKSKS